MGWACNRYKPLHEYEITITGDVPFSGSYRVWHQSEVATQHFEDERPPLSFPESGDKIEVSLRKKSGPGWLKVEIREDGKPAFEQKTSRPFGALEVQTREP